jgi:hypothetical protein
VNKTHIRIPAASRQATYQAAYAGLNAFDACIATNQSIPYSVRAWHASLAPQYRENRRLAMLKLGPG